MVYHTVYHKATKNDVMEFEGFRPRLRDYALCPAGNKFFILGGRPGF
jgi:hypothetical protein